MTHLIYITPVFRADGRRHCTNRGPLFDVTYDGEHIARSIQPFLDGARALTAKGLTGKLEMWDHELPHPRMRGTIEGAAKLTTFEPNKGSMQFRKYMVDDRSWS